MRKRTITSTPEPRYVRRAQQSSSGRNIDDAIEQALQSGIDYNFMGLWIEDNEYHPNDLVIDPTNNNQYINEVAIEGSNIPPSQDIEHWHIFLKSSQLVVMHITIDPPTAEVGTFSNQEYTILTDNTLNYIVRQGEIYRLYDESNSSYLTYVHTSIDTSKSDKPAVIKTIRVNLETKGWEYTYYKGNAYDANTREYIFTSQQLRFDNIEDYGDYFTILNEYPDLSIAIPNDNSAYFHILSKYSGEYVISFSADGEITNQHGRMSLVQHNIELSLDSDIVQFVLYCNEARTLTFSDFSQYIPSSTFLPVVSINSSIKGIRIDQEAQFQLLLADNTTNGIGFEDCTINEDEYKIIF